MFDLLSGRLFSGSSRHFAMLHGQAGNHTGPKLMSAELPAAPAGAVRYEQTAAPRYL